MYDDVTHSMELETSEAEMLESERQEAEREARRLDRWETLNEEAAIKFRKDFEAAQIKMRKFEKEYAVAREAAKTKPKLHSGGGNWGRYEYVWEEEDDGQSKIQPGSKRSNRATSFANSPSRLSKRRRIDDSSPNGTQPSVSRYGRERKATEKSVASGSSDRPRMEPKEHPAKRRKERPRPPGPIFSAIPPSPSRDIIAQNDFDILPIPNINDALDRTGEQPGTEGGQVEDIYDSDVEIIASNVTSAVREGRLEERYGSNVNPISLEGDGDNAMVTSTALTGDDISYSSHFDASAPHLMPVTPGSVDDGGVLQWTTGYHAKEQAFPGHPNNKNKSGINPLKSREVFCGTLSNPDTQSFNTQYVVRPENYQFPSAVSERGKGTRAAVMAMERTLSGKTLTAADGRRKGNPLLYSAEAEIARARQVAAFLESAKRRKPIRSPLNHRHIQSPRRSHSVSSLRSVEHKGRGPQDDPEGPPDTNPNGSSAGIEIPEPIHVQAAASDIQQDTTGSAQFGSGASSNCGEDTLTDPARMKSEAEQEDQVSTYYMYNDRLRLMAIMKSLPLSSPFPQWKSSPFTRTMRGRSCNFRHLASIHHTARTQSLLTPLNILSGIQRWTCLLICQRRKPKR